MAREPQNHAARALKLCADQLEHALAQTLVCDEFGIQARDAEIGFSHADLDVAEQVLKERKAGAHVAQELFVGGAATGETFERMADAEEGGHNMTTLHPAEDPRDGAQVCQPAPVATLCGARTDARVFEFADRRRLLEVGYDVRVVCDLLTIERKRIR